MKICPNCGLKNNSDSVFCMGCGAKLQQAVVSVSGGGLKGSIGGQKYAAADIVSRPEKRPLPPPRPRYVSEPVSVPKRSGRYMLAMGLCAAALILDVVLMAVLILHIGGV